MRRASELTEKLPAEFPLRGLCASAVKERSHPNGIRSTLSGSVPLWQGLCVSPGEVPLLRDHLPCSGQMA